MQTASRVWRWNAAFEIIGEAITQCNRQFPASLSPVSDTGSIVAFCNKLAHGYHSVDDILVWRMIEFRLPQLLAEVHSLIDKITP